MESIQQTDVWTKANEEQMLQALATLGTLPSRPTFSAEFDSQVYLVALDGVTRHGLSEAVKAILRGCLGHTFFPSPVELRHECEKAMEWHERERQRVLRREKIERENAQIERSHRSITPEARARVAKIYAKFCRSFEKPEPASTSALDPELLQHIPESPKVRERMGRRSA